MSQKIPQNLRLATANSTVDFFKIKVFSNNSSTPKTSKPNKSPNRPPSVKRQLLPLEMVITA